MNRTAQRIPEIVLSRLSVYIRVCGDYHYRQNCIKYIFH